MELKNIPNQSFHLEQSNSLNCNACKEIVDLILNAYKGISPRQANGLALQEFEEMMDDKMCRDELICLPLCRLRNQK